MPSLSPKFLVCCLLVSVLSVFTNAESSSLNEKKIQQIMQQLQIPGAAIGIVKDGKVIAAKGFGVKTLGKQAPIDTNSIFKIASNTKAFTATALMMLQEEGKLDIDDKVTDYLPWFKTYDPFVTNQMTIRDLLCHRSGLKTFAGDLIWYGTDHSAEEVVRRSRHLEPTYGFREKYGYFRQIANFRL